MSRKSDAPLAVLTAEAAEGHRAGPCVVIVRTRDEFTRWMREPMPGVEWVEVENLLGDPEVWAMAAQGMSKTPLDVILGDPAAEYSLLYRLVDVRTVRPARVTMPAAPGFMKALRLAASLQIPVRLLPGQPSSELLAELTEAAQFYLRDPMVETPVEFFHSLLASFRGSGNETLWAILEEDPALFERVEPRLPRDFVKTRLARLIEQGAECAACRWQTVCAGYFKWPDADYNCGGVKGLFGLIEVAAEEIGRDLAGYEGGASRHG